MKKVNSISEISVDGYLLDTTNEDKEAKVLELTANSVHLSVQKDARWYLARMKCNKCGGNATVLVKNGKLGGRLDEAARDSGKEQEFVKLICSNKIDKTVYQIVLERRYNGLDIEKKVEQQIKVTCGSKDFEEVKREYTGVDSWQWYVFDKNFVERFQRE